MVQCTTSCYAQILIDGSSMAAADPPLIFDCGCLSASGILKKGSLFSTFTSRARRRHHRYTYVFEPSLFLLGRDTFYKRNSISRDKATRDRVKVPQLAKYILSLVKLSADMRVAKDQIQFLNKYIFYLHYINKIKTNNKQQWILKFDNTNATLACTTYLLGQFVHTKEDFLFFPTQCNSPEHDTVQNQTLQFPSLDVLSSYCNGVESFMQSHFIGYSSTSVRKQKGT